MTPANLQIYFGSSPIAVARQLAAFIQARAQKKEGAYSIALSGGSTPMALFEWWRAHPEILQGARIEFWWVDERMVPYESGQSNYGNAYRALFAPIAYPTEQLHPIPVRNDLESSVSEYHKEIQRFMEAQGRTRPFDLVILGVGDDGHTSSLFPGQPLHDIESTYLRSIHPTNGIERVALSYHGIAQAAIETAYHVMGQSKEGVLSEVVRLACSSTATPDEAKKYPAAYAMRCSSSEVHLFTDILL